MSANTSTAVMSRRIEAPDSLDFFPTPAWATRALCEFIKQGDPNLSQKRVWEPACGQGHMARPLTEYFELVYSSDAHEYDWLITNPPFRLAEEFAHTMIDRARVGAAILVRTAFLEGKGRWESLFSKRKPSFILQFTERVVMHRGKVVEDGSSATAYCWIVWECRPHRPSPQGVPALVWIPPCRRKLERGGDYVADSPQVAAPLFDDAESPILASMQKQEAA